MIYRELCNKKVSQLGFGCMRLPTIGNDSKKIDKEKASTMIKEAIKKGVNYIDTAWPYHGEMSELFVGEFLKENNLRDEVFLASKLPVWMCKEYDDFGKYLDLQLEKLQTDHIDFYLLHALDQARWDDLKGKNIKGFISEAKASGKVRHFGFSFHDTLDAFKEICDSKLFDFCQIQLNYMDIDYQAGLEGLRYAKSKGIPVIIMEPIKGGKLAFHIEGQIKEIWDKYSLEIKPAQLALKYLYNLPEINLILSGMSTMEHVIENVEIASSANVGDLTGKEQNLVDEIKDFLESKTKIPCTRCKYCIDGCPQEIKIDDVFDLINSAYIYDEFQQSKDRYAQMDPEKNADTCIECGQCEEQCPQNIKIIEALKMSHSKLTV